MEITPGRAPFRVDEEYEPLRRPKYQRNVQHSNLSAFAKEFVPRSGSGVQERLEQQQRQQYNQQNYQQYQQPQRHQQQYQSQQRFPNGYGQQQHQPIVSLTSSVQNRLRISSDSGSSNAGQKNSPNNYYQQQRGNKNQGHHSHLQKYYHQQPVAGPVEGVADVETIALEYLKRVIQCLNQNPGQFDTIGTRFITIFEGMENNQYVLSNAMEDIFNESIQNPNFRYMGAKLYNLLHMLNLNKDSLFHTLLKCKLDFHQQEVLQFMQTNQQAKVRETALFLAELYMQLRGDDSRIHLIAENIVFSLKQLLLKESTDNVRCICLTLKLAGYDLTADCPNDMKQIIAQLDEMNCKSPGKYPLAANVISLQKNNWGRKLSSSNSLSESEAAKSPEPLRTSDEPVFYGPDGREMTAEESDFLSSGGAAMASSTDDDEDAADLDVDLDPEMDEETEEAYKEFCKQKTTT